MTKALVTGATRAPVRVIATTLAKGGWEVHALGRDRIVLEEMARTRPPLTSDGLNAKRHKGNAELRR